MVISWIFDIFMAFAGVSGTVGATTLTVAQLAKHTHTVNAGGSMLVDVWNRESSTSSSASVTTSATGSSSAHTHSLTGVKSGSASSLPPYYALAFIMRVA